MIIKQQNLLGNNNFYQLIKMFTDSSFAWYWQSDTNYGTGKSVDVTNSGFRHCFYKDDEALSDYATSVLPIVCAMADLIGGNLVSIYSVHANMLLNHNKQMEPQPHIDLPSRNMPLFDNQKLMTGIFYLETVDGNTLFFEDDKKTIRKEVSPVENSMVIFDSTIWHSASLPMIAPRRRVINLNIVVDVNQKGR